MSEKSQVVPANPPVLSIVNGKVVTTSVNVAEHFNKKHKHVIDAIKTIEVPEGFSNQPIFRPVEYQDAKGEKRPMYQMTRDGFVFLVMGFTGKNAAKFKWAYIQAFNAMEAELTRQASSALPGFGPTCHISPAHARQLQKQIADRVYSLYPNGPEYARREAFAFYHRELKDRLEVSSYLLIPADKFDSARNVIENTAPKRALAEKTEPKPVESAPTPAPAEWQESWDMLEATFGKVRHAAEQLKDEVNGMLAGNKYPPADPGDTPVMVAIKTRYQELARAARQIQFLENMLMWMSPAATIFNMQLGNPGDGQYTYRNRGRVPAAN